MRILLTGSTGWLGRHLAPLAQRHGHQVIGLDVAPGHYTNVVGSVADRALVDDVFAQHDIEVVLHAAALHKPDIERYPKQAFVDVNVTGTLNLLEAAVSAGHDRFIFTSTTSLMISAEIRAGHPHEAIWLDESAAPLTPRNIYGATKLAAEQLCRVQHLDSGIACVILRTSRFFPEEDDMAHLQRTNGINTKANELLHRRLTVEDAAAAHLTALEQATRLGFGTFLLSAPTPFCRADCAALKQDAPSVIRRYFPDVDALYTRRQWRLPKSIGRVYDSSHAERQLGFRCATDFGVMLDTLRTGEPLPLVHDANYVSPKEALTRP